jgi:enoyl-[acyl-carrier protein] reductase II
MNRVTQILKTKYPIVQAPMTWLTSPELAAAVANAGGFGSLGPNAGMRDPVSDPVESGEKLREAIRKTRSLTKGNFGINYIIDGSEFSESFLKVTIEEKVGYVIICDPTEELDTSLIRYMKDNGLTVIYRQSNPTVKGAVRAEKAGADIIVATGYDEGGGMPKNPVGTMTITAVIADAVSVPVLAAGGIVNKKTVNAAFALGAEGVFCGTRFLVAEESPISDATKQDIIHTDMEDLFIVENAFCPWRCTPHEQSRTALKRYKKGDIPGDLIGNGSFRQGMLLGDLDHGIVTVNNAINLIQKVDSCENIIREMMADYKPANKKSSSK